MTATASQEQLKTDCDKTSARLTSKGYPVFIFNGAITPEQLCFFKTNGLIHFKHFITPDEVSALREEITAINSHFIANNITKVNGVPIKFGKDEKGNTMVQRFAFASLFSQKIHALLQQDAFTTLNGFLSENARIGINEKDGVVINHYINNPGSSFSEMGWHTDSLRDLFYGTKIKPMLNVGVHLDDTKHNGSLKVLAGTHTQNLWQTLFRKRYFLDKSADKNELSIEVEAGDLTIHDGRIWHRMERSTKTGPATRRRVMYFPIITGEYKPKNENSPTPFYQRFYNKVLK